MSADERQATEVRTVEIARRAGLPEPDEVEYRETSIVLLWHDLKLAVMVDEIPMDEPAEEPAPEGSGPRGAPPL